MPKAKSVAIAAGLMLAGATIAQAQPAPAAGNGGPTPGVVGSTVPTSVGTSASGTAAGTASGSATSTAVDRAAASLGANGSSGTSGTVAR